MAAPYPDAVTDPELLPMAAMGDEELHTPPPAPSVKDVMAPGHDPPGLVIVPALGVGFTVRAFVAAVPHPVL